MRVVLHGTIGCNGSYAWVQNSFMAFNIKNKRVCEFVWQVADRFETTQVDVIERALLELFNHEEKVRQAWLERIMELVGEIHDSITDEEREALRNVDQEIYDEDGLP